MQPLRRPPNERWERMAIVAFEEGIAPDELVEIIGSWGESMSGSWSQHFSSYIPIYERLSKHGNPKFHTIGQRGIEWARARVAEAEKREKLQGIFGR
jgi:hypothetical protein